MPPRKPFILAGRPVSRDDEIVVTDKFTGEPWCAVCRGGPAELDAAAASAAEAFDTTRRLPAHERERILLRIAATLAERRATLVEALISEVGKPRRFAQSELERSIDTFHESARRAMDVSGAYTTLDQTARGAAYRAVWRRVPLGPVAAITPFNFPLNLAAHKIGPAIAAGCPFVLKPASVAPVTALLLGEIVVAAGWPAAACSVVPSRGPEAQRLAESANIAVLSFTGSPEVGWSLKARAGRKRVVLELGGNAAVIVHEDADLDEAARRCAAAAFSQAGQSCISVQRILVHAPIYTAFKRKLVDVTQALVNGNPAQDDVTVGPLISMDDALRVEAWVNEALTRGAHLVIGGRREGTLYSPTILEDVRPDDRVSCREVFAPLAVVGRYGTFEDALRLANDTDFGLQAGVFTRDMGRAWQAFDELSVGGVIINDVPTFRAENMPYGGVKGSGVGREGPRWAVEDYTELRSMVMRG